MLYKKKNEASSYEQTIAAMLFNRLNALCKAKTAELLENGIPSPLAEAFAETYIMQNYCDGHSCAVYAVAQARMQLLREGYIPSNATTMPSPWCYDPYARLCKEHAQALVAGNT